MTTFHDRCTLHPQQRIVGICAYCLRERLTHLIESTNPADVVDDDDDDVAEESNINCEPKSDAGSRLRPQALHAHQRSANDINATLDMAPHCQPKLEEPLNLALQKVKHAHDTISFLAQSPYQGGGMKVVPEASPLGPSVAQDNNVLLPASRRQSKASEPDVKMYSLSSNANADMYKKRGSWFSITKLKNSQLHAPSPQEADGKHDHLRSPKYSILAGRKSASDAIGHSCKSYRQAYMADLEAIAEINLGEAAINPDNKKSHGDHVHTNSSWISSLFHRRKGPRFKSDLRHDIGSNNMVMDDNRARVVPNASIHQSPKPSIDAGRLSWDGARPNFTQILGKIDARNKQQRDDCLPLQVSDYAMKWPNDKREDISSQASSLQKCKSVASARSRDNINMPKSLRQASLSPMLPHLLQPSEVAMDHENMDEDMDFHRSGSWGRAWNRTLSPLLGFKHHGRKGGSESPLSTHHLHPGSTTPSHTSVKYSIRAPAPSSTYLSPLRGSKQASDARIYFGL